MFYIEYGYEVEDNYQDGSGLKPIQCDVRLIDVILKMCCTVLTYQPNKYMYNSSSLKHN